MSLSISLQFKYLIFQIYMSGFMKTVLITTTTAWDFSKIIHRLFTQKPTGSVPEYLDYSPN